MVNRMRANRSHRDNRRSHHALSLAALSKCSECGGPKRSHHVCEQCGKYKGKLVVNVGIALDKKEKKMKARQKELTAQGK